MDPKRKKIVVLSVFAVVMLLLLIAIARSPILTKARNAITGEVVSIPSNVKEDGHLNNSAGQSIRLVSEIMPEEFVIPIDNLDVTIKAKQVDILSTSADISLNLEQPMVFEAFKGQLSWRNSILTLEGQLSKHLSSVVKINWKNDEDVRIRVQSGQVSAATIDIQLFESVVSGTIKLGDKLSLITAKDSVSIGDYRGKMTCNIDDQQAKLILDGYAGDFSLNNEEFEVNIT
ncbi:MAG: hypothetical protein ABIG95_03450 [Candidatus Woesearchaeota archaeon]